MGDIINDILRAADRHPNSRVSKLIRLVEEEPSQKNIVLLLIELSDHAEYSTDFNISLRYYLDIFEKLGIDRDLILNEAGLLLVNSSKIYSKRVDYVQSLVERQIMTLSNADNEIQQQNEQNQIDSSGETTPSTEKPKRGRKRALDTPTDPYEVQLEPKKIKKMTQEKRFSLIKTPTKTKPLFRNVEMEQQIHPAGWKYATIYDLENEEDVDTKRNYKLFTYHIEHRYNTLVPDINFRLHFKVKDYMDAQEEEMDVDDKINHNDQVWPSHSEEYVRKYISLENRVLQQEINPKIPYVSPKRNKNPPKIANFNDDANISEAIILEPSVTNLQPQVLQETSLETPTQSLETTEVNDTTLDISVQDLNTTAVNACLGGNDSGLGTSDLESSLDISSQLDTTQLDITNISEDKVVINTTASSDAEMDKSLNASQAQPENDSALGESILDQTQNSNETATEFNITQETQGSVDPMLSGNCTIEQTTIDDISSGTDGKVTTTTLCDQKLDEDNSTEISKTIGTDLSKNVESANLENSATSNTVVESTLQCPDLTNTENSETCDANENIAEASGNSDKCFDNENTSETNKIQIISVEKVCSVLQNNVNSCAENRETLAFPQSEKNKKNVVEDTLTTMDNADIFQVEIEVVNDEGKAESNTIQIQIPNSTDDEGVHLSDAFEDDFRLLSPTLKIPNIMPGIERKDVTIYLDKELREALELRDNMVDHFSQETYKVPVIVEPKEQPLIFNILQLPPKVLKRKTLFKLGPDMELYLKARMQKSIKSKEPRILKRLQFLALNNTDGSGCLATPPNSPGQSSDFLGFTDEDMDDAETTCGEFCGFTEDEQNKLLFHRLSRDSGVGIDVATLTPEKERLEIIFEEVNAAISNPSCAVDLGKMFVDTENVTSSEIAKENTEDLLNNLSIPIRNVLEAEIEHGAEVCQTTSSIADKITQNETESKLNDQLKANEFDQILGDAENLKNTVNMANESQTTNVTENSQYKEINFESQTTIENETEPTSEHQLPNDNTLLLSEESLKESGGEVQQSVNNNETNTDKESNNKNIESLQLSNGIFSAAMTGCEVPDETAIKEHSNNSTEISGPNTNPKIADKPTICSEDMVIVNTGLDNDNDSQSSQQDNVFIDLDTQGAKTKIQQWHEHLRPILAKSRDRHHFDVFQIGTEIIEKIQSEETVEPKCSAASTFDDIMDNKDKSYVSRYFLSTLLLANQSNINISVENKSSEMPSSWSDIQLKLISTKRHTVAIEDNIGMINNRKRKNTNSVDKVKNKKSTAKQRVDDYEDEGSSSSTDDSEPLVNLQTIIKNTKVTPTKRPANCKNVNETAVKRFAAGASSSSAHQIIKSQESNVEALITSQSLLPPIDIAQMMPATSQKAVIPNPANSEIFLDDNFKWCQGNMKNTILACV